MATLEKLQKALDSLKNITKSSQPSPDIIKRDKIQNCRTITEAISNPTIKVSPSFSVILGVTIETFLGLCDDPDSDVRMISDECLNRVIRITSDTHIGKIQIELYKEIKKNGSSKSLRAALVRFSQLAHLIIRPHKGKVYVANLFPVFLRICERSEEAIHEALASGFPKIIRALGCFASESDIKILLKAFLKNITNSSTVIRRTSTSCILHICLNSKRPYAYVVYCIESLLDLLLPLDENLNKVTILGVLGGLKVLLPHLNETYDNENHLGHRKDLDSKKISINKLLQIYELCINYLKNKDHNVVIAAFETLNVLLLNANKELKNVLLNPNGIDKSRVTRTNSSARHVRSPSQVSVSTTVNEDSLFSECELTETVETDIVKWINESKLSMLNAPITVASAKSLSVDTLADSSNLEITDFSVPHATEQFVSDSAENFERRSSENSSERSYSVAVIDSEGIQELEIGEYLDKTVPLLYCTRLIIKSFLLYGVKQKYISDRTVRVSVKSSAINCLTSIFKLYPSGFYKYLDIRYKQNGTCEPAEIPKISVQSVTDVTFFSGHPDPQLRGAMANLVAELIVAILEDSHYDINSWLRQHGSVGDEFAGYQALLSILEKGLTDENSNCLKQTLTSLNPVLNMLANSFCYNDILGVLEKLPLLASNPYWLVKVALCELVSKLCYVTIFHNTRSNVLQNQIIYNVLFELLRDVDQRIRTAAANAFVEIIGNLYYQEMHPKESAITLKTKEYCSLYLKGLEEKELEHNINKKHFIRNMPFPYSEITKSRCDRIEFNLSIIISKLYVYILTSPAKHFIAGCIETLSLLSSHYPPTVYKKAWNCCPNQNLNSEKFKNNISDLLSLCVSLLTSSSYMFDVQFHVCILDLVGNLYAGYSVSCLLPVRDSENSQLWGMFSSYPLQTMSEILLSYVMKLLHVFHTILNDIVPVPQAKIALPHLPTSNASPIKRQKSNVEKKSPILGKTQEKEDRLENKNKEMSTFVGSSHYMKIYDVLKSSFVNYKISLNPQASEKFIELMRKILKCLSILLEVSSLNEFGRISEEILLYLKSTFTLDSVSTVQCVQQLLKCLFGTNLACNISDIIGNEHKDYESTELLGFYDILLENPLKKLNTSVNILKSNGKLEYEGDNTVMGFLRRRDIQKTSVITRVSSDKTLASYIKIFEPIVIKSLKHYTMTTDAKLQSRVLQLLSQLVQLRVNYCLLDSEQVFKDFVIKQFEYIEEGQISYSEELLPKVFQFLVHLSYSKQHSKNIIELPKIIQLCDELMASGQRPETHCIPSLEPIIEDVFFVRSKSNTNDLKELETMRDVVFSMLLRLFEYQEVIDFVTSILEDCKFCADSLEKWIRWSNQAFNVFVVLTKQNKIKIDNTEVFISLKKFISSLHPEVFSSVDEVLIMIFQDPPLLTEDLFVIKRWLSKTIILLLILLPHKEEELLSNINRLKADFSPGSILENFTPSADPLNVHNNADIFEKIPAEKIVVQMLLKVIYLATSKLLELEKSENDTFLVGQLSVFLTCCRYILTGNRKISDKAATLLQQNELNVKNLNDAFLKLTKIYPTLVLCWWHILTLLNYSDLKFWKNVMPLYNLDNYLTECIMMQGETIILSHFLTRSQNFTQLLSWMLNERCHNIVDQMNESPVLEFVYFLFQQKETSEEFLNSFKNFYFKPNDATLMTKIQKSLAVCHASQLGTAIKYLVNPMMLKHRQIAISTAASTLATRKLEILLTLKNNEVKKQLSEEEILRIKEDFISNNLDRRFETLVSLFNKILLQFYDYSLEHFESKSIDVNCIKNLDIDKKWYFKELETKIGDSNLQPQIAKTLCRLDYSEVMEVLSNSKYEHFDGHLQNNVHSLVGACLEAGIKCVKDKKKQEEPAILKAAIEILFNEIEYVLQYKEHQLRVTNNDGKQLYDDYNFVTKASDLVSSISSLMRCMRDIKSLNISEREFTSIFRVTPILMEFINYDIRYSNRNVNRLEEFLNCGVEVLSRPEFFSVFATDDNIYWLCLFVNSVHGLIEYLLKEDEPLPSVDLYILRNVIDNDMTKRPGQACHNLYVLVQWLYRIDVLNINLSIPKFLYNKIKRIVISLARLPQFYSYNIVPLKVWKTGWEPELSGKFLTEVPGLPMDYLQEVDILEDFIFRVSLLGWTSRQQFEETWMSYLSVLCYPLDSIESMDFSNSIKASCRAVRAISVLLMQTIADPILGNSSMSQLFHVSRNKSICDESISIKKLKSLQNTFEACLKLNQTKDLGLRNIFTESNFEKCGKKYSYGQLSIKYFMVALNIHVWDGCAACETYKKRRKMLEDSGIDVNSCLQFLLDYFSQLLQAQSSVCDLGLLHDIVKCTVFMSDLFTDKLQFEWMQNTFIDLLKMHSYEDELLHQYLIVGLCKAAAVFSPELETFEQIKKTLAQFLKNPFVPSRIACLYGILYLMEGCLLNNTKIGGVSEETQLLLPLAVEYLQLHLKTAQLSLHKSQEHQLLVWGLAFFLIENIDEVHMEANFVDTTLSTSIDILRCKTGDYLEKCIIKALERLLVVRPKYISEKIGKQLYGIVLDYLKTDNPIVSLMGFQLFLTFMYIECAEHLERDPKTEINPDQMVHTIEKTTVIFDTIKRGYTLEAELICEVLPKILDDFFSPSDILTKVIGEFLSSQQPYPKLLSGVVFKVFESAISQDGLSLLQDWVVFSLSNFTQSFSNMAVWSLTCFFISASTNQWLRAIFPYVQTRIGRYEQQDKQIFCVAGSDFYKNLSASQKKMFVDNFAQAKYHPDTFLKFLKLL